MQYNLVGSDGEQWVTVYVPGQKPLSAGHDHPAFEQIVEGARKGDASVIDLFDMGVTITNKFERLSERVTTKNGVVYKDGVEVNDALTKQILAFISAGVDDWKPLVNFFENIENNENDHSREQLYTWLAHEDFTITPEGLIVGYKGVRKNDDGTLESIKHGKAIVDGEVFEGAIPQREGSLVEMPRDEVQHDPAVGCHQGLHVGTYDYASGFSQGALLEVHVNPRDVVSVPTDCNWAKVRTCRYTIVGVIDAPYTAPVLFSADYDEDAWGDNEDDWGDEDFDLNPQDETLFDSVEDMFENQDRVEDEQPVADLDNDSEKLVQSLEAQVNVGDVFETTDSRRAGTQFKVESVERDDVGDPYAVGKSLPRNLTRKVALDRLLSYRYRKV